MTTDFRTCDHEDHWINITENRIKKRFCTKCGYTQESLDGEWIEDMRWAMLNSFEEDEDYTGC